MIAVAIVALLLGIGVDIVHRRQRALHRQVAAALSAHMQQITDKLAAAAQRPMTDPPPFQPK
jgi:hypothetical protein